VTWTGTGAVSCNITNNQNSLVYSVLESNLDSGTAIHNLPEDTIFTLSCEGGDGSSDMISTNVELTSNLFPETLGYYGSASSFDNSWVAIVNLTTPITFQNQGEFEEQVDAYCTNLGYIGSVRTESGNFATSDTYFLQAFPTLVVSPFNLVTLIPNNQVFENVNITANDTFATLRLRSIIRAVIGNGQVSGNETLEGFTRGENPTVLCQTNLPLAAALGVQRLSADFGAEED